MLAFRLFRWGNWGFNDGLLFPRPIFPAQTLLTASGLCSLPPSSTTPPLVTWRQKHPTVLFILISGQTPGECSGVPGVSAHATLYLLGAEIQPLWALNKVTCHPQQQLVFLTTPSNPPLIIGTYTFCYQTAAFWGRVCVSGLSAPPGPRHSSRILFPEVWKELVLLQILTVSSNACRFWKGLGWFTSFIVSSSPGRFLRSCWLQLGWPASVGRSRKFWQLKAWSEGATCAFFLVFRTAVYWTCPLYQALL